MSKTFFKYGLWTLTLATVWWICAIVSAVVAGKGGDSSVKEIPAEGI